MKEIFSITKLDHFGRGVSKFNDKILFIENAIDGEVVEAEIVNDKKKVFEGVATKIYRTEATRKNAECPYYDKCGGCNIMHMKYTKQLDFKLEKVSEILERFAGINRNKIKSIISSSDFFYRNKVTLKVKGKIGFYKNRTYDLVPIKKCIVCSKKINEIIEKLTELKFEMIDEIIIRSTNKDESMVVLKANDEIDNDYYERELKEFTDNLIVIKDGISTVLFGKGFITEKLGDYYFKVSPLSFFQVNTNAAEKLYNIAKEYASLTGKENVLDLYCGTGTIGIFLSNQANKVTGIEINSEAVEDALENKKLNGINNIDFVCKDVSKIIEDYNNIDVVILDPPRSGLSKKAMDNITKINPKRIVYISCDPATLARDLFTLKENYDVEEVTLVDMFPNTYHVECVCILNYRKPL